MAHEKNLSFLETVNSEILHLRSLKTDLDSQKKSLDLPGARLVGKEFEQYDAAINKSFTEAEKALHLFEEKKSSSGESTPQAQQEKSTASSTALQKVLLPQIHQALENIQETLATQTNFMVPLFAQQISHRKKEKRQFDQIKTELEHLKTFAPQILSITRRLEKKQNAHKSSAVIRGLAGVAASILDWVPFGNGSFVERLKQFEKEQTELATETNQLKTLQSALEKIADTNALSNTKIFAKDYAIFLKDDWATFTQVQSLNDTEKNAWEKQKNLLTNNINELKTWYTDQKSHINVNDELDRITQELADLKTAEKVFNDFAMKANQTKLETYITHGAEIKMSPLALILLDGSLNKSPLRREDFLRSLLNEEMAETWINQTDNAKQTPLHLAVLKNNLAAVKLLVKNGANVNAKNNANQTPLSLALTAKITNLEIATCLIESQNIKVKNESLKFLLDKALKENHFACAKTVFNKFKNPSEDIKTPLLPLAINAGDTAFVEKLLEKTEGVAGYASAFLKYLIEEEEEEEEEDDNLKIIVPANINTPNKTGQFPLFIAYNAYINASPDKKSDFLSIVHQLLKKGAEFNIPLDKETGDGFLHLLAKNSDLALIKTFKEWFANVPEEQKKLAFNAKNNNGKTPLDLAIENQNTELAKCLVDNGAPLEFDVRKRYEALFHNDEPQKKNADEETSLFTIYKQGEEFGRTQVLMKVAGIDENQKSALKQDIKNKNAAGDMILHLAAEQGDVPMIKWLLDENNQYVTKEDINLRKKGVGTILHVAARKGDRQLIDYLINELHMDKNILNDAGETPLHVAAKKGNLHIVNFLAHQNAEINIKDKNGKTAGDNLNELSIALSDDEKKDKKARKNHCLSLRENEKRKNEMAIDEKGNTWLHLAVATNDIDLVNKVLKGINLDKLNSMLTHKSSLGNTPLDLAIQQGNFELAKLFLDKNKNIKIQLPKTLPPLFQNYLAGEKNLAWEEEYSSIHEAEKKTLLTAVQESNITYIENLFDELYENLNNLNDKNYLKRQQLSQQQATQKKQAINNRIFELVNVGDANGTSLKYLATRAQKRQLARLQGKKETENERENRKNDAKIARILTQHVPKQHIPEEMAFYDLLDDFADENKERKDEKNSLSSFLTRITPSLNEKFPDIIAVYEKNAEIFDNESDKKLTSRELEKRRLEQGKKSVFAMSDWIKYNENMDINDRDTGGNTVLHLALQDNMDAVVGWLLPATLLKELGSFFDKATHNANEKLKNLNASVTNLAAAKVTGAVVEKAASVGVGIAVGIVGTALLGPFGPLLGIAAGKATEKAGEASEKLVEVVSGALYSKEKEINKPNGVNVNQANNAGDTPLHLAARDPNKLWVVAALLPLIENINAPNVKGETPLHVAVQKNNQFAIAALLNADANIDARNLAGETPLHLSVQKGDSALFHLLLKANANSLIQTELKQTAADLIKMKLILLHNALDKAKQDKNFSLQASLEIQKNNYLKMKYTLQNDTKNKARASQTTTSSSTARQRKKEWEEAEKLKSVTQDKHGNTLLHLAAQCGDTAFVEKILSTRQVDINQQNAQGETFLHLAARAGHPEMITLLLAQGADMNIPNKLGKYPFQVASNQETFNIFQTTVAKNSLKQKQPSIAVKKVHIQEENLPNIYPPVFSQIPQNNPKNRQENTYNKSNIKKP